MTTKAAWGLDIGSSSINAVKMVSSNDEVRITQFDICEIQDGNDETTRSQHVQVALNTLMSKQTMGYDPVYLSLPGSMCMFRMLELPIVPKYKLDQLVKFEAAVQLPIPIEQVEMAWERHDDADGFLTVINLFVAPKNIIDDILELTDVFKLNIQGIAPSPVALFNFGSYEYEPAEPTLLINVDCKSTAFVVMNARRMYFDSTQSKDRDSKLTLASRFNDPQTLGAEILNTIHKYEGLPNSQKIMQSYLLGYPFHIPGVPEMLAEQFCEITLLHCKTLQRIRLDDSIKPELWNAKFPAMSVAIGLSLQGLGLGALPANLIGERRSNPGRLWVSALYNAVVCKLIALGLIEKVDTRD